MSAHLKGEERQPEEDKGRDHERLQHDRRVDIRDGRSERDGFEERKDAEEDHVRGGRVPLPVHAEHGADGSESRDEHEAAVLARPVDDRLVRRHEPADQSRAELR